nr:lysM domain receptor-like kinase 3 [Ipomoea batatas]
MAKLPTLSFFILLVCLLFNIVYGFPTQISNIIPFPCYTNIPTCTSALYQHNGLDQESISTLYSISPSNIYPISRNNVNDTKQDYLVAVPCSCKDVNGTVAYFYETPYTLQQNDTFAAVSINSYSGQAWKVGGEERSYKAGDTVTMHLLCGCLGNNAGTSLPLVTTYTIQPEDTLPSIADLLSSQVGDILKLNPNLAKSPGFIDVGWLIYVPLS